MTTPSERPVDLMIDLRERMIRIETMLELRVQKDIEIATDLIALKLRTTAIEAQALVLKTHINVVRWIGGIGMLFLGAFGSSFTNLFGWQ